MGRVAEKRLVVPLRWRTGHERASDNCLCGERVPAGGQERELGAHNRVDGSFEIHGDDRNEYVRLRADFERAVVHSAENTGGLENKTYRGAGRTCDTDGH